MAKINLNIEIIRSTNSVLSSLSHESAKSLQKELSRHYSHVIITIINNFFDLEKIVFRKPDIVFTGIKFVPLLGSKYTEEMQKIWVTQYLEYSGISCTGSGSDAHRLELDKSLSKQIILDAKLPTSKFFVVPVVHNNTSLIHNLEYPLFVKPLNKGGGMGIDEYSVVNNYVELVDKVSYITRVINSEALVEEYLPGREFSVAILKNYSTNEYLVMPLELIAPKNINGDRYLSRQVKKADSESFQPIKNSKLRKNIKNLALNIFIELGARDYGRIDIRLDSNGNPNFLEANLIPSLVENYGNFPKACFLNNSINYSEMLINIINHTIERKINKDSKNNKRSVESIKIVGQAELYSF